MNREFLKELGLDGEVIDKVMAEHGKSLQGAKDSEQTIADLKSQVQSLTESKTSYETQLEDLKKSAKDSKDLQKQIADLQDANKQKDEEYKTQLVETQKSNAIELALRDAGARNSKAVSALLDKDTLVYKDGKLVGLDDQLSAIKQDNDFLFQGEEKPVTPQIVNGGNANPKDNSDADPFQAKIAQYK